VGGLSKTIAQQSFSSDHTRGCFVGFAGGGVDVINAGSTTGLANTISRALSQRGYTQGEVRNPFTGEPTDTGIDYGSGAATEAQTLATLLGIGSSPRLDNSQEPGHIRVILGPNHTLPSGLGQSDATPNANNSPADTTDAASPTPTPDQGQPVDGGGIPCVDYGTASSRAPDQAGRRRLISTPAGWRRRGGSRNRSAAAVSNRHL
jgi:hypothetical protein